MRFVLATLATVTAVTLPLSAPVNAQTKVKFEEVASGLTHPLAMVSIPDGSGRKAVIEQTGLVRIIDARGRLLPEPFLNIQSKLVHLEPFFDEQGLLGIAFHPQHAQNGRFFSPGGGTERPLDSDFARRYQIEGLGGRQSLFQNRKTGGMRCVSSLPPLPLLPS